MAAANAWQAITPDEHGDWLKQRDDRFKDYIPLGDKKLSKSVVFSLYCRGLESRRDAWCYNASKLVLTKNVQRMAAVYNEEVRRFSDSHARLNEKELNGLAQSFVIKDSAKISWTPNLLRDLEVGKYIEVDNNFLTQAQYRPFSKTWAYSEKRFVWSRYHMPIFFPDEDNNNRLIIIHGSGETLPFTALMSSVMPDVHFLHGSQCFPLYLYEADENPTDGSDEGRPDGRKHQGGLFPEKNDEPVETTAQPTATKYQRRDAITDAGLAHFRDAYPGHAISKEDVFYYVYGLLHSPDYRERYADNLSKELPRIPRVKTATDFWAFSQAGRALANFHLNYEAVEPYPATITGDTGNLTPSQYRVEKMKYGKKDKDKDLSVIHYNAHITVSGIPLEAYNYVVNGKSAIDWVMERQCVKTEKDSGIVNDANDWAVETMENPRYPLELLLRVVTVSLETQKIVAALPKLDI